MCLKKTIFLLSCNENEYSTNISVYIQLFHKVADLFDHLNTDSLFHPLKQVDVVILLLGDGEGGMAG